MDKRTLEHIVTSHLPKDEAMEKYERMGAQSMGGVLHLSAFNELGFTCAGDFDVKRRVGEEGQGGERMLRAGLIVGHAALLKLHNLLASLRLTDKVEWRLLNFTLTFGKPADDSVPKGSYTHFTRLAAPEFHRIKAASWMLVYDGRRGDSVSTREGELITRVYVDGRTMLAALRERVRSEESELGRRGVVVSVDASSGSAEQFEEAVGILAEFTSSVLDEDDLLSVVVFSSLGVKVLTKK